MAYIAIIEDDEDQAKNLMRVLQAGGHEVHTALDTESGFKMLEKRIPDIVILDVMFPGNLSGGFDLARKLYSDLRFRDLPIIMLTSINQNFGFKFSDKDIDPVWMPVTEFMDKPVDFETLKGKIAMLLHR